MQYNIVKILTNLKTKLIMNLTNKRTMYSVANEDTNLKLTGEIIIGDTNAIANFNGSFFSLDGTTHMGGFSYSESGETCNKNFHGLPISTGDKPKDLLDKTIAAIKSQLNA